MRPVTKAPIASTSSTHDARSDDTETEIPCRGPAAPPPSPEPFAQSTDLALARRPPRGCASSLMQQGAQTPESGWSHIASQSATPERELEMSPLRYNSDSGIASEPSHASHSPENDHDHRHAAGLAHNALQRLAHWRDAGTERIRHGAITARDAVYDYVARSSAVSGLGVFSIDRQFLSAALGHLLHQFSSVGPTTFLREMGGEALFAALRKLPPEAVIPLQVVAGSATMALHQLRQKREQRNPDAAARGFHNLSLAQWNALSPQQRDAKRQEQRRYSDAVSSLALAGVASNIVMSAIGPSIGQPETAARVLTSDIKIAAYAVARDTIQAMYRMVGTAQQTNGGISGGHITSAGHFYSMANIIANNTAEVFVPADLAQARQSFAGLSTNLTNTDSIGVLLRYSAIKATINTLLETSDWINVTQEEAAQAGTRQQWDPAIKGRRQDVMRVLDQSIARTAAIDSNIALGNAIALIAEMAELSLPTASLLGNTVAGAAAGMQYKIIGATWQAEAAVREVEDRRRPPAGEAAPT